MLRLKCADDQGTYYGFTLKNGFWYGINTETQNFVATSGWECNGNVAIYELIDGKWQMFWYDITEPKMFEISNIPEYSTKGKMSFIEWLETELGIEWNEFDEYYDGKEEYRQYDKYLYDGLPNFIINYIIYKNIKQEVKKYKK